MFAFLFLTICGTKFTYLTTKFAPYYYLILHFEQK